MTEQQMPTISDIGEAIEAILFAAGYPVKYESGKEITGLDSEVFNAADLYVYHAGTKAENGKIYTAGGRVLGVTATGKTLEDAIARSYSALKSISFEKMHYRNDIGRK
jgi:phosphoribosylamine--glycine ligase